IRTACFGQLLNGKLWLASHSPRSGKTGAGVEVTRAIAASVTSAHAADALGAPTGSAHGDGAGRRRMVGHATRPRRKPCATAWARSRTPSLRNNLRACVLTVSSER